MPLFQCRHHSLCSPHALYCLKWRALAWCYCMPPGPLGADWWLNATHTSQLPSGMGRRRLADCKCHLTITQRAREDWGVCEELQGPTFDWYIQGSQVYKQIIFFPPPHVTAPSLELLCFFFPLLWNLCLYLHFFPISISALKPFHTST